MNDHYIWLVIFYCSRIAGNYVMFCQSLIFVIASQADEIRNIGKDTAKRFRSKESLYAYIEFIVSFACEHILDRFAYRPA